jgi:hypothetical protein
VTIAGYGNLAIALAVFYASEAKRLRGSTWANQTLVSAERLLQWLQKSWAKPTVSARDIYTMGPSAIRDRDTALKLAGILVAHGWLRERKTHRRDRAEWDIVRMVRT